MHRSRRRVVQASVAASLLSGAPSTLHALAGGDGVRGAVRYGVDAMAAIGVLVPPWRPGVVRGAAAHLVISALAGEVLARTLPRRGSIRAGAAAGLVMGVVNLRMIGRRFPEIRALPLLPQLADNVMFGALFAAVADRR